MIYCIAKTLFLLMKMYLQEVKNENFRLRRATQRKVCIKLSISIFYWKKYVYFGCYFWIKIGREAAGVFFGCFFWISKKIKMLELFLDIFPKALKKTL